MKQKDRNKRRVQIARRWAALRSSLWARRRSAASVDQESDLDADAGDSLELPDSLLG